MYDRSGGGAKLRKYMGVSLAWWHSYKWATAKIINVFARDFIAPFYHYLFPTNEFRNDKMSHSHATTLLSYIRLAYPLFKDQLQAQVIKKDTLNVKQATLLQNLSDLCEYFIPVVIMLSLFIFIQGRI